MNTAAAPPTILSAEPIFDISNPWPCCAIASPFVPRGGRCPRRFKYGDRGESNTLTNRRAGGPDACKESDHARRESEPGRERGVGVRGRAGGGGGARPPPGTKSPGRAGPRPPPPNTPAPPPPNRVQGRSVESSAAASATTHAKTA